MQGSRKDSSRDPLYPRAAISTIPDSSKCTRPRVFISVPHRNEIIRWRSGRVARNMAVSRRLRGLMRILFSDPCRGRRCRPVGSQRLPLQCPVFDVERLLAKAFGVGRLLRTAKAHTWTKKTSSWRVRSGLVRCITINQSHADAHHRSRRRCGPACRLRFARHAGHLNKLGRA
jgi:hypothetical protein